MKKVFLAGLVSIVLVACGGNDSSSSDSDDDFILYEDNTDDGKEETNEDIDAKEKKEDETDNITEEEEASETTKDEVNQENESNLSSYDEYDIIHDHVDLDTYTGVVQTDNRGNRVILFENKKGEKEYKSVYLKKKNRLKIIQLTDDTLLFNEVL